MRLLFAVLSLTAAAVFALQADRSPARYRFNEVDDRNVEPFRTGQTYKYRLDTQVSSGMASVSEQHATTRIQADALIYFQTDRQVTLKLQDIVIGTTNAEIQEPEKVQPMGMFKENEIKHEESRQLELPCTFDYVDGLVERVRFSPEDRAWSKNIKKSVLNMLQLNLKQRQQQDSTLEQPAFWKQEREMEKSSRQNDDALKMFVMPEITLEGECQITYTMNKIPTSQVPSRSRDDDLKMFNVTKSINFQHCAKIADTRFGPKMQKPCTNCSTAEQLEENKLDRTTVLRHVVVGTHEKYGIKKAEVVSHYVFKTLNVENETPMRVIVAGRLSYIQNEGRELRQPSTSQKEETLMYSTEWDHQEKLFYMYGDEEFPQNTPFEKVQNKVEKIEKAMKELLTLWSDKVNGIETEATIVYSRIIGLLRMCSQDELKEVYSNINSGRQLTDTERRRAEEIIVDALATTGTYNSMKVLVDKILKKEIQPSYAVRALIQLKDVPAPSEKQVEILTHLCQNEVCSRHGPCQQVCWLSTGSIMGQLCDRSRTVQDSLEQKKNLCQHDVKKNFVKKVMTQFEKTETRYEKIVMLKALGNAGLEQSVQELEKIVRNVREEPIVRMQAIDSLRRLRAMMPQKIQRILMPVYQNVRERPEIRMMCLSQILATFPEKPILDQFGLSLIREPSRQVKSYVYGAMKKLSESPVPEERQVAQHLKSLVKLAGITEEDEETLVRGSRFYRIPVYSMAKKEGFMVELESMVGSDNVLPKHLSAGLDSYINGLFQKNSLELSMTQEDVEQWAEKLIDIYMDYQHGESKRSLRGYRSSAQRDTWDSDAQSDFRSIVSGLGIERRSDRKSDRKSESNTPYGMLNIRYGDVDYAILPIEEEFMPQALKKILVQGQRPSLDSISDYIQGRPFSVQLALNLLENSVKIPTSAGLPIRMWHVIPILASVEGKLTPQLRGSRIEVEAKLHKSLTVTHLKRVEIWLPIVNTGVETSRSVSINLPLTTKIQINNENDKPFKLTVEIPENKFRALKVHTLPLTFVSEQEWHQQRNPVVKRIENKNLVHRSQPFEKVYGKRSTGMPIQIVGEIHFPQETTYESLVNTVLTTENHLEVVFESSEDAPRRIELTVDGEFFQEGEKSSRQHHLKGFHAKSKFDDEMNSEFEDDRDSESNFDRYLDKFDPKKILKHRVEFELKTVGGRYQKSAQLKLEAECDSEHRYVKTNMQIRRSPFELFDETKQWTMKTELSAVLPELHQSVQQYKKQQGEKNQKLVIQAETEWGSDQKQSINLNINGEEARNPEWRQKIQEVERLNSQDAPRLREQMIRKVAFLNKYDISAEYRQLTPQTKNFFNHLNTLLKVANFWNTRSEMKNTQRDNQITATIVIDPITHQHVNITLKSPVEITRINSAALPIKIKPFKLVRPSQSQQSIESFTDLVSSYAGESRPECKVDSRKIRSFDDVVFKAPLTKCYSVLAKDCGSEKPRFAVLMKKINNEEKALKVLANGDKIEIEPKGDKLEVKINGKRVHNEEELQNYGIEAAKNLVRIETRDVSVRFDGEEAQIKVSPFYKNKQCGLCGHYDDDTEDEFRTSKNEWTSDLKSYHKSYSLVDDECRGDLEETHRREEYKPLKNSWNFDFDSDEQEQDQRRRRTQDNEEIQPFEKTETMEYNHKICFSIKPVKACPEGSYAQKTKEQKIQFACMDRSSAEARRLLRQARRSDEPLKNIQEEHKISFVETITMPTACVEY